MSPSVRRGLFAVVLIALFILALNPYGETSALSSGPPHDGDRPPIIISDGTVDLTIDPVTPPAAGVGEWQQVPGNKHAWFHDQGGPAIGLFRVNLINATGSANCTNSSHDFEVTTFDLTFRGIAGGTAVAKVESGHFRIDFKDADAEKKSSNRLKSGWRFARHLKTIKFPSETCGFNGNGTIVVRQFIK